MREIFIVYGHDEGFKKHYVFGIYPTREKAQERIDSLTADGKALPLMHAVPIEYSDENGVNTDIPLFYPQ